LDRFASVRAVTLHGCLLPLSTRQRTAPRATSACRPRGSHFLAGVNPVKRRANLRDRRLARDRGGPDFRDPASAFLPSEASRPFLVVSATRFDPRRGAPVYGTRTCKRNAEIELFDVTEINRAPVLAVRRTRAGQFRKKTIPYRGSCFSAMQRRRTSRRARPRISRARARAHDRARAGRPRAEFVRR